MTRNPKFSGGGNIAIKVPPHQWDDTVRFYRDVLKLEVLKELTTPYPSVSFRFGDNTLWIDRVPHLSQSETWLELSTDDVSRASGYLKSEGVIRCDEIEPLPDGFDGFWIQSPSATVHIVKSDDEK